MLALYPGFGHSPCAYPIVPPAEGTGQQGLEAHNPLPDRISGGCSKCYSLFLPSNNAGGGGIVETAIESVWGHIKNAARDFAGHGATLTERDAEAIVVKFMRDAHISPWPSVEVIEFYARELQTMVETDRATVR